MDVILLLGRLVLTVVFATAGLLKLVDRAGTRHALAAFGVPPQLVLSLGLLLPLVELGLAIALLPAGAAVLQEPGGYAGIARLRLNPVQTA